MTTTELSRDAERVRKLEVERDGLQERVEELTGDLDDANEEITELKAEVQSLNSAAAQAIDDFVDEIERPVGTMRFIIPMNDRVNRAIIAMCDAIGRKL